MPHRILVTAFVLFCFASPGFCDEKSPESASDKKAKPAAKKDNAKRDNAKKDNAKKADGEQAADKEANEKEPAALKISGVFQSLNEVQILADTEQISSLEIKRIVKHGGKVSQGQNVVSFDAEDIDKQIKEAEIKLRLAKLTMGDDEFAYQQFLKNQALDKQSAERARKNAQQNYDNFVQIDRDRQILAAEFNVKSSQASLDNATEELEQLEQMYKEDDLTEESEEIVLKRAKQSVEFAQYRLDGTKASSKRSLEQTIPNATAQQEATLAKAQLTHEQAIRDLSSARQRREIEMGQKRDKFKEQQEKLAELKQERKKISLAAPIEGIALLGALNRGRLGDKPSTLEIGSKVTPSTVIATIVNPRRLQIRVSLEQKDLSKVKVGAKCKVTCKAFPDFETTGTVKSVSSVAYAGTKHDCVVNFKQAKHQPGTLPTMSCDLEFASKESDKDE
ncbi:MAG: HlyD family secretion protein [Rubripirellula sp.]